MSTATFVTSEGSFTVQLMPEHAPETVANFVGLATGAKDGPTPATGDEDRRPVSRHDLPPGDRRLHDPGRRPHRHRHGRARVHVRRRVPARRTVVRPARTARDGQRRTRHERMPVLRDRGADRLAHGPTHDLRRGHRGYDVVERISKAPTAAQDRPSDDIVIERIDIAEDLGRSIAATAVCCYGDSNTWGLEASTEERLQRWRRWPGVMQRELGEDVHVIEEGLSGRTTVFEDPFEPGGNGRTPSGRAELTRPARPRDHLARHERPVRAGRAHCPGCGAGRDHLTELVRASDAAPTRSPPRCSCSSRRRSGRWGPGHATPHGELESRGFADAY